jgi:hypothetical protein
MNVLKRNDKVKVLDLLEGGMSFSEVVWQIGKINQAFAESTELLSMHGFSSIVVSLELDSCE